MFDVIANTVSFSISRIILAIGVAAIFVSMPLVNSVIDYTGEKVEAKSNMTEINVGVDGLNLTLEEKKEEQTPYLTASQVYYDILNYNGTGYVQCISETLTFSKSDINRIKAGDSTSEAYQNITELFATFTDNDRFIKTIDGDTIIYEQVYS